MELRLNLASRVYLDRRTVRRWLLLVGLAAVVLLAANLIYGTVNLRQLQQVEVRLAELDAKIAAQRSDSATTYTPQAHARVMARVAAANQIIAAERFRWTALLSRLEELLPDDVAIRTLKPNYRDRSLQVSAVARDTEALTEVLDVLLASEDLNQAYLLNQALTSQTSGEVLVQFSLVIREAF